MAGMSDRHALMFRPARCVLCTRLLALDGTGAVHDTACSGFALDSERRQAAHALGVTLSAECDAESTLALGLPSLELQRAILRALA